MRERRDINNWKLARIGKQYDTEYEKGHQEQDWNVYNSCIFWYQPI